MEFITRYLEEVREIASRLDQTSIEALVKLLAEVRSRRGRVFVLGIGGNAGNASHAVSDFRKMCSLEAYAPTDNVSELTARINDEGWETCFADWLKENRLSANDVVCVLSVSGGDVERGLSVSLVRAVEFAKMVGARVCAIVGPCEGYAAKAADVRVIIPMVNPDHVTAHTEAFQAVIWHLLVTHPLLQTAPMRWESLSYAPDVARR